MTPAQKKQQKKREYQRKWYAKNRAKQKAAQQKSAPVAKIQQDETIPLINIINAYYVLHSATTDGQIRADLNKVLSSIIAKQ